MKNHLLPLACALCLWPSAAQAQVSLHIDIGLPVAPPLVEVQPGIQVVEGFPEEVFFSAGWYWCRRPDGWYRARSPRARFDWVDRRFVPGGLVRMPGDGRYRNWHHGGPMRPMGRPMERPMEHRMEGHGPMGDPHRDRRPGQP
jgi:hypothetical protein